MSLVIYPDLYILGEPLVVKLRNVTTSTTSFNIKFYDGSTLLMQLISDPILPAETITMPIAYEYIEPVLSNLAGKTICVTQESSADVVYLGGPSAPRSQAGLPIFIASSVRVNVVDYLNRPLPFAKVELIDIKSQKKYTYFTDANGVVKLPDLHTTHGQWIIEVFKKDYATNNIHYYVSTFNFAPQTIICSYASRFIVTLELQMVPGWVSDIGKALTDVLPEPFKSFAKWLGTTFGFASSSLQNYAWNAYIYKQLEQSGAKVTSVLYDPSTSTLKISAVVEDPVPIVVTILIIIGVIAGIFTIGQVMVSYFDLKAEEEKTRQTGVISKISEDVNKARQQGAISEDTYKDIMNNLVNNIRDWQKSNLGVTDWFSILLNIIPIAIGVLVIILIISLVSAIKK